MKSCTLLLDVIHKWAPQKKLTLIRAFVVSVITPRRLLSLTMDVPQSIYYCIHTECAKLYFLSASCLQLVINRSETACIFQYYKYLSKTLFKKLENGAVNERPNDYSGISHGTRFYQPENDQKDTLTISFLQEEFNSRNHEKSKT